MSPTAPHTVASTAGQIIEERWVKLVIVAALRMSFFDPTLAEQTNTLTRFKKALYGVTFRRDGKLIGE